MIAIFYIVFQLFSVCNAGLSEILNLQKNRCVVALLNVEIGSPVETFFNHFVEEFSNNVTERFITFREYKAPFTWDDGSNFDLNCGNTCLSKIGIFKKNPEDLKCLFPLPKIKHTGIDAFYKNLLNPHVFSEFLNEHCETFFSSKGDLLSDGLFSHHLENDVTMTPLTLNTLQELLSQVSSTFFKIESSDEWNSEPQIDSHFLYNISFGGHRKRCFFIIFSFAVSARLINLLKYIIRIARMRIYIFRSRIIVSAIMSRFPRS